MRCAVNPVELQDRIPDVQVDDLFDANEVCRNVSGIKTHVGCCTILEDHKIHQADCAMKTERATNNTIIAVIVRCTVGSSIVSSIRQRSGLPDVEFQVIERNLENIRVLKVDGRITASRFAHVEDKTWAGSSGRCFGYEYTIKNTQEDICFNVQADLRRDIQGGESKSICYNQVLPVNPVSPAADLIDLNLTVPDVQF